MPSAKIQDLQERTADKDAIPCIIPVKGSSQLNSIMWIDIQKRLRDEEIEFLIDEIEFKEELESRKDYLFLTSEQKREMLLPYIQTERLIYEAVNLSQTWKDGRVKLEEPRTGTKDRIVALSYGNYVSSLIEAKLNKSDQEDDYDESDWDFLSGDYSDVNMSQMY